MVPRTFTLAIAALVSTCIALSASSAVSASKQISFDRSCYIAVEHPTVTVNGSGFAPGANLALNLQKWVKSDKKTLQLFPVTADATGAFSMSFPNPGEDRIVTVSDASEPDLDLSTKTLKATKFEAGYKDGMNRKGPTRAKDFMVLFGSGFAGGQQGPRGSGKTGKLYLHRVAPGGSARTEMLSHLRTCGFGGTNQVTGHPLFKGGGKVRVGKWKFQFDTKSAYKAGTNQKIVLRLKVSKSGIVTPGEQTKAGKIRSPK